MAAVMDRQGGQSEPSFSQVNPREADSEKNQVNKRCRFHCSQAHLTQDQSDLLCFQKEAPPPSRSSSNLEVKLMEKIPEAAEATVVLVGTTVNY